LKELFENIRTNGCTSEFDKAVKDFILRFNENNINLLTENDTNTNIISYFKFNSKQNYPELKKLLLYKLKYIYNKISVNNTLHLTYIYLASVEEYITRKMLVSIINKDTNKNNYDYLLRVREMIKQIYRAKDFVSPIVFDMNKEIDYVANIEFEKIILSIV